MRGGYLCLKSSRAASESEFEVNSDKHSFDVHYKGIAVADIHTTLNMTTLNEIKIIQFSSISDDLVKHIASFLPPKDLLQFQCISSDLSRLDTDMIWKNLCQKRWDPWPRYRLTPERIQELNGNFPGVSWKDHYRRIEREATCIEIKQSDFLNLCWYLSFNLSGVRGETQSDWQKVHFTPQFLMVPGYPPLPYAIMDDPPPRSLHIRPNRKGDQPFSTKQWLQIADFPSHGITRRLSNAEWMIVNENVTIVSCE